MAAAKSPAHPEQDPKPAAGQNPPPGSEKYPVRSLTADVSSKYQIAVIKAGRSGKQEASFVSPLAKSGSYENTVLR